MFLLIFLSFENLDFAVLYLPISVSYIQIDTCTEMLRIALFTCIKNFIQITVIWQVQRVIIAGACNENRGKSSSKKTEAT